MKHPYKIGKKGCGKINGVVVVVVGSKHLCTCVYMGVGGDKIYMYMQRLGRDCRAYMVQSSINNIFFM
jgi:hypothetical protein